MEKKKIKFDYAMKGMHGISMLTVGGSQVELTGFNEGAEYPVEGVTFDYSGQRYIHKWKEDGQAEGDIRASDMVMLRDMPEPGDIVCVTGADGNSAVFGALAEYGPGHVRFWLSYEISPMTENSEWMSGPLKLEYGREMPITEVPFIMDEPALKDVFYYHVYSLATGDLRHEHVSHKNQES